MTTYLNQVTIETANGNRTQSQLTETPRSKPILRSQHHNEQYIKRREHQRRQRIRAY